MLRDFSASPARVFTCSQHVRAFTVSHLKHVTCSKYAPSCSRHCASAPTASQFSSTISLCGSVFTPCGTSSGTSAPAALCCSVTLSCSNTIHCFQQRFITCPPAVGHALLSKTRGPRVCMRQPSTFLHGRTGGFSLASQYFKRGLVLTRRITTSTEPATGSSSLCTFCQQLNISEEHN